MDYVNRVKQKVRELVNNANQSVAHRMDHLERVIAYANQIADKCANVDREVMTLAILLHDVNQSYKGKANHVVLSKQLAEQILNEVGCPNDKLNRVLKIISEHSTEHIDDIKPSSLEAKVIFDADKIDGLGATGIARVFCLFGQVGKGPLEALAWYRMKISKSIQNLQTQEGKRNFSLNIYLTNA